MEGFVIEGLCAAIASGEISLETANKICIEEFGFDQNTEVGTC